METEYLISEGEYVRANKLFSRPRKMHWLLYGIAAVALIALAVAARTEPARFAALFALVGGIAGYLFTVHVYGPWQTRRQYRSYAAVRQPGAISLTAEGLRFQSADMDALVRWQHLMKWRENDEFLLLYQNPRLYHVIPKRLNQAGFDTVELAERLTEQLGAPC